MYPALDPPPQKPAPLTSHFTFDMKLQQSQPSFEEAVDRIERDQIQMLKFPGVRTFTEIEALRLADALAKNTSLVNLKFPKKGLTTTGSALICSSLWQNTSLFGLDVCYSEIGDVGAMHVATLLKRNTCITNLDIGCTNMGSDGAKAVASALESNRSLLSLSLIGNPIGAAGATSLARALRRNSTLTTLEMRFTRIEESGAYELVELMKLNTTLVALQNSSTIGLPDSIHADLEKKLTQNADLMWKYQEDFIRMMLYLAVEDRRCQKMESQSVFTLLPAEIRRKILSDSIAAVMQPPSMGKSVPSVRACASFILDHIDELRRMLNSAVQMGHGRRAFALREKRYMLSFSVQF